LRGGRHKGVPTPDTKRRKTTNLKGQVRRLGGIELGSYRRKNIFWERIKQKAVVCGKKKRGILRGAGTGGSFLQTAA